MLARLLLGVVAALRAVLIPGQFEVMAAAPLQWPDWMRRAHGAVAPELESQPGRLRAA